VIYLQRRQCEFTAAVAKLITRALDLGYTIKVQEWNRTLETQKEYVLKGVSRTLDSRHLDNLAVDVVLFKDGVILWGPEAYRGIGEYWETLGGRWGGRFGVAKEDYATKVGWDSQHMEFSKGIES
jgi:hypothetical protein